MEIDKSLLKGDDFSQTLLDAFPSPVFVVDRDVRILAYNSAASRMVGEETSLVIRTRAGEVLSCVHSEETPGGCGGAPFCKECVIRNSTTYSYDNRVIVRDRARMELIVSGVLKRIFLLITTVPFQYAGDDLVLLILDDISALMEMRTVLPICSRCKKIRDDENRWRHLEQYLEKWVDVRMTHGLCPECLEILYSDFRGK